MNKIIPIAVLLTILIAGCVEIEQTPKEEILTPNQGVDITETLTPPGGKVSPGSTFGLGVQVRNNLEGATAYNVVAKIDNLLPFMLVKPNGEVVDDPSKEWGDSAREEWDLDYNLPVSSHGVSALAEGQEVGFVWMLRAPPREFLGGMEYKHNLYLTLQYTYMKTAVDTITFMSDREYNRITQENGTVNLHQEFDQSAGEITITPKTQTPFIYFISDNAIGQTADIMYDISNIGGGLINNGVHIVIEWPNGLKIDESSSQGWQGLDAAPDKIKTKVSNPENARYMFISSDRMYKPVTIDLPLKQTQDELNRLNQAKTPSKTYIIKLYIMYDYRKDKQFTLTVLP